jgi:Cd2+/Zn2+-exporting ATPase/Cu+-exporting ATPase
MNQVMLTTAEDNPQKQYANEQNHQLDEDHDHSMDRVDLVRIGLVALAVVASWFGLWQSLANVLGLAETAANFDIIALLATLVGGYPIFKEAVANLVARRMTMELSMTIALAAALAIGEFFTALVIVLFVLVAEVLEGLTVGRGRQAIKDLLDLLPQQAVVRRAGGTHEVGAAEIRVSDVVLVKPGGRVPVDGVVVAGNSFVDQAPITGESLPVEKLPGSSVYAGTINQSGVLEVRTEGIGRDTAFGKIIEAVERAEQSRAPIQKTADRLAGYLVYFAIGCAALTFLVTHDVRSTISVVIVAGACGIAAGTPLAVLGAIGRAARQEAIIKAREMSLAVSEPEKFQYLPGKGIACSLAGEQIVVGSRTFLEESQYDVGTFVPNTIHSSEIMVGRNGRLLGSLQVEDTLRPEAVQAVTTLQRLGLRTVLLTGDVETIAQAVGNRLGLDEVHAELLPDEKVAKIKALRAAGRRVAMVGDGINDAPALAESNVGVAMGSGTDVARESADVVLLGNDLLKFVETVQVARRCRRIIWFNFVGTLAVDSIGMGLAAVGMLNPLFAAFIHVSSELAFILNSARLLPGISNRR